MEISLPAFGASGARVHRHGAEADEMIVREWLSVTHLKVLLDAGLGHALGDRYHSSLRLPPGNPKIREGITPVLRTHCSLAGAVRKQAGQ